MSEDNPQKPGGQTRRIELEAMKTSIETRTALELQRLTALETLAEELEQSASGLPPLLSTEPVTEAQKKVQQDMIAKIASARGYMQAILLEEMPLSRNREDWFTDSMELEANKIKTLDTLLAEGLITQDERVTWALQREASSARTKAVIQKVVEFIQEHEDQINR